MKGTPMAKKKLGRGLQSLLSEPALTASLADEQIERILQLDPSAISPNPYQPRTQGSPDALEELKASIRENGILQPVVVRAVAGGYQLVAGERRWQAATQLRLPAVPAIVREADEQKMLELALVENIQREDLNPIERAHAYRRFLREFKLTQEQAAARLGIDRSQLANNIRLLDLPEAVQEMIADRRVSFGHGKVLLRLSSAAQQIALATRIAEQGVPVRQTERLVEALLRGKARKKPAKSSPKDPNIRDVEDDLRRRLGTKVTIVEGTKPNSGRLVIEYYSLDDFDRILQAIQ
jgi:ParB family chromosome partitioning protein